MSRVITALLQVALLLSLVSAILQSIRMILQQSLGIGRWYWAGSLVAFLAPIALSLALLVFQRTYSREIASQSSGAAK